MLLTEYLYLLSRLPSSSDVTSCIGCPTRYRTRHFFNNFTTTEDIETKFEALQTRTTDIHYTHTLRTCTTDTHYGHALRTCTTDTLRTCTTDTHYRHALWTRTTDTHYEHALQTRTTDTHYRHALQTHSSSFLTQRTYSCSLSSLVVKLLKKRRVR